MSSHMHGLALDWMVGATVVLANSTIFHCTETENADIFWALRGAGSSFGVVAEYEFETFEAPESVTHFSASLPWDQESAIPGWKAMQDYAEHTMPAELNMRLTISPREARLEGLYYGDSSQLQAAMDSLLSATGGSISQSRTVNWLGQLRHYAYGMSLDQTYPYSSVRVYI